MHEQTEAYSFAVEDQARLASMLQSIAELGYDQATHDRLRRILASAGHAEAEKAELDKAQQLLAQLHENRNQLLQTRQHWLEGLRTDEQRHAELSQALAGIEELNKQLEDQVRQADNLHSREGHARQTVGAAQQKLDTCRYLDGQRRDRAKDMSLLAEERSLFEELQLAFGKKGLQALIIETAIPELEEEANRLLDRMTDGRMTLRFDTQRDTRSHSTVETLDIKISDENGTRSYEMFSGGEAFRINFAIRIALSKLLARRSGAQLQTLIVDEGFGTQDADGRLKLVEAINSIRDDFARILVITHIEELKDAFPVRIDVYKTAQGSQISVA
jgi:exonuclease SbcC